MGTTASTTCAAWRPSDTGDELASILDSHQRLARGTRSKAEVLAEAADRLVQVGIVTSGDAREADQTAGKRAYTGVKGLGWVTWGYFLMLLGVQGVKADMHIRDFVTRALDRTVSAHEAHHLVTEAAHQLDVSPTALDHAVWAHQRSRGPRPS